MHKRDLQPVDGASPNHITLDEPVIRIDDRRYRLYDTVDPETNVLLQIRPFSTTTAIAETFPRELAEKNGVENVAFLVDGARYLQTALRADEGSDFDTGNREIGPLLNVYFER